MLLPVAMIPYLPQSIQVQALICFSTLYLLFASFANPPWGSLMADLVPERKERAFFSKRGRIVGLVTVISAFLAGYILHLFKTISYRLYHHISCCTGLKICLVLFSEQGCTNRPLR